MSAHDPRAPCTQTKSRPLVGKPLCDPGACPRAAPTWAHLSAPLSPTDNPADDQAVCRPWKPRPRLRNHPAQRRFGGSMPSRANSRPLWSPSAATLVWSRVPRCIAKTCGCWSPEPSRTCPGKSRGLARTFLRILPEKSWWCTMNSTFHRARSTQAWRRLPRRTQRPARHSWATRFTGLLAPAHRHWPSGR